MKKQKSKGAIQENLSRLNLNAAGIDIGSSEHYVAVPEDRDDNPVRSFKSFTPDLHELARWLKCCKIDTVVMESTSVYWIPLFQILESEGFEVLLVNAKSVKNVPGRKSDVNDCQWLQQLHTYGLLSGSFQPDNEIRELRTYLRQKNTLTRYASSHVQHIQKSLTLMNIQLHNVISDITGKSGMAVIREIVKGERDPEKLVEYCSDRLKNPKDVIKKSLIGNYTEDNIFILKQAIDLFDYYEEKILECDTQIQKLLKNFDSKEPDGKTTEEDNISSNESKQRKKKIESPVIQNEIIRLTGVDLTRIAGLNTSSVLCLLSETGFDMNKWKSEKHFTNWLGLAPNNKISGGKVLSCSTKKVKSRANNVFRLAAFSVAHSNSYLGGVYKKLRFRLGPSKANVAVARKIAVIYFNMLKYGKEYFDYGCEYYEQKHKEKNIKHLHQKAKEFGFQLVVGQQP